jgi:purine-binding chemotaxis protein CheW
MAVNFVHRRKQKPNGNQRPLMNFAKKTMTPISTQSRSLQSDELQFATFRLGELLLGVDIREVSQISRPQKTTPVPHAPASVLGVINMRGEVNTVIDLGMVLGFPPIQATAHVRQVIVRYEGEQVGLLVDRLADIICVRREAIGPRPENLNGLDARFLWGVCQLERELLTVLDLEQTLAGVNHSQ